MKKQTPWATTGASTNVSSFDPCFEPGLGPVSSLEPLFDPAVSLDPLFSTSSLDPLLTKPSSLDPLLDATSSLDPLLVRPGSSFDPFFLRGLWFGSSFVSLDPFAPGGLGHWHYVPLIHVYELHLNTKPNAFWGPHPYGKCYFCTHATNQGRYATEGNTSTWVKIFWALPGLFEPAFCLPSQKFASHSHFQTSRCKLGKFWAPPIDNMQHGFWTPPFVLFFSLFFFLRFSLVDLLFVLVIDLLPLAIGGVYGPIELTMSKVSADVLGFCTTRYRTVSQNKPLGA